MLFESFMIITGLLWLAFMILFIVAIKEVIFPFFKDETPKLAGSLNLAPPTPQEDQATLAYVNNEHYLRTDGPEAKQVKITTTQLPTQNVTPPMGSIIATTFVNVMEPVLVLGTRFDDLRIYYPDNTIEYFSALTENWQRVATTYNNVYEYATRTNSIIMENV